MKCNRGDIKTRLIRKAAKSSCRYRVAAIGLDYRGRVIASTNNKPRFPRTKAGIHAEMALMLRAPKSLKTIIIVRVNRQGDLMPIDPCAMCSAKAEELGITIKSLGA